MRLEDKGRRGRAFCVEHGSRPAWAPNHADGFKTLIMRVREEGITQEQIDMMVRTTPAQLLGLEPW